MHIDIFNGEWIEFSNKVLPEMNSVRHANTSYLNEFKIKNGEVVFNSDFYFRLICYRNTQRIISGNYSSLLDIFGGVGITAKIFTEKGVDVTVNDWDKDCVNILEWNFKNVHSLDAFNFKLPRRFDLIIADYNDFTAHKCVTKNYLASLKNITDHSNKYVIINDCSIFYLKYGKKSYDNLSKLFKSDITCTEDLLLAEKIYFEDNLPGWKVRHIEYFHNSSFFLFEKCNECGFSLNKVNSNKERIIHCQL